MTRAAAMLSALAELSGHLGQKLDLDTRIDRTLSCLHERLDYRHSMLLVPADAAGQLVMLASHGYDVGVGAQVRLGDGAIGVCAERRRPLRLNNVARALTLIHAAQAPTDSPMHLEIPLPGIAGVQSQLVAPALVQDELVAVLYVEDERPGRFDVDDSHALQLVASLLAPALFHESDDEEVTPPPRPPPEPSVTPLRVRYYAADGSVFFDDEYVIKSLPGRILFKLLKERRDKGREEFTKKELRLDACLQLPAVRDNLDTRLILLRRRLVERFPCVQIAPVGRGRFRVCIDRPFELVEVAASYP
jgi:adenylate cyclase